MTFRTTQFLVIAIFLSLPALFAGCMKPSGPASTTDAKTAQGDAFTAQKTVGSPLEKPEDGDWIVAHLPGEMENLNPITSSDSNENAVNSYIMESLLQRDNETLEMKPLLAKTWEASADHLSYTFHLYEEAKFSDGQPVTADDVKFSFDTIMDPKVDAAHLRNYYKDVTACDVLDPHSVRFTCDKPYFRHLIMLSSLPILPKHVYGTGDFNKHANNRNPIGSGPYVLESWTTGQQLVLTRNENYWGEKPPVKKRVLRIVQDNNVAFELLLKGELDTMEVLPEQWINRTNGPEFTQRFNKHEYYGARYSYIGWNSRKPQFQDKMVRRALTMLLNRDLILKTIYYNLGVAVTNEFFIQTPEYNRDIKPFPYDPEQAKQLLAQAGWKDTNGDGTIDKEGVEFAFELIIRNGSPEDEQIASNYKEDLRKAGIDMTIRKLEWATLLEKVDTRTFDAVRLGWQSPPDSDPYQVWHSSQMEKGSNYVGFNNPEADKLIEEARETFDHDARIKMYHRFSEIVYDEQPYTFMFCIKVLDAVDKRFHNVVVYPSGLDSREWFVPKALQKYK